MEIIFTRYLLALGLNRTCSGFVHQVREAVKAKNTDAAKVGLKVIMERYKFGSTRLLKMKQTERAIFSGLKGRRDVPEFSTDFLDLLILLFEINFASAFIEKIKMDNTPTGIQFMRGIAVIASKKAEMVRSGFTRVSCEMSPHVIEWCNVASIYFQMMAYWAIYKQNTYMMEKIIEKTKDIETIYFENHLLANKIIDLKHTIEKNIKNMNSSNAFNGTESAIHVS